MEHGQFDALTRLIAVQRSRRSAIGTLLAGVVSSLLLDPADASSRKRHGRHKTDQSRSHAKSRGTNGHKGRDTGRRQKEKDKNKGNRPPEAEANSRCCSRGCAPGAGSDLRNCCFERQNLAGANFSRSNLAGASFRDTILTNADFSSGNLSKACLVDANMSGAKLKSANLSDAIYCRTRTSATNVNNSGCGLGTPCCPTCDGQHPCAADQVCCNGRCVSGNCCDSSGCAAGEVCCGNRCLAGDCCRVADCSNEVCQQRACQANQCVYTPVRGAAGPLCPAPRVCCQDGEGNPTCCAAGVPICQANGLCGCGSDDHCDTGQKCCNGTCIDMSTCCEGNNAEGCPGDQHCCVVTGSGVCGECCTADQCPDETCQTKSCAGNNQCQYAPVFGDDGPGCATVCCQDADAQPVCCPDGTMVCTTSGRCRCEGVEDCGSDQICCNGACIANTLCCAGNPSTCPAPGACQIRACGNGACQPRGVSGGSCPIPGGGTGVCRDGSCVCPSPRITCNNVCCSEGVTACAPDGTCPRVCDVCASGCSFTSVAAAVAGTNAGGTIRICPGTYATLNVRVDKNLTIVGAGSGADGTILDGQRTNRIFTIADGVTATIRDLAITRGLGTQQDNTGAGILVRFDASLTLERVEVTDNANPSGFGLGAIYVAPRSSLLLKESRVANNLNFSFGGGIMTDDDATVTVEASRIEGNSAGFGGGIWIDTGGVVNLDDDSLITANFVFQRRGGGGIFNKGRVNGATSSNVTGNTGGNPPVPSNCDNSQGGTGCPA